MFWGVIVLVLVIAGIATMLVTRKVNLRWPMIALVGIATPLAAFLLYWQLGFSEEWLMRTAPDFQQKLADPDAKVIFLERYLKRYPKDAAAWRELGRFYMSKQRYADAATALQKAFLRNRQDPELLVEYVQALYFSDNPNTQEELNKRLQEAHLLLPADMRILALLADTAFREHRYADAIKHWQVLLQYGNLTADERAWVQKAIEKAGRINPS